MAERTGLEPATPGVTGRYSNQLNYRSDLGGRILSDAPAAVHESRARGPRAAWGKHPEARSAIQDKRQRHPGVLAFRGPDQDGARQPGMLWSANCGAV